VTAWPNLFLVGAAKAGTTSLWRYLSEHPDVFMSPHKEPHFFAGGVDGSYPVVEEAEYLRLFRGVRREAVVGEASTSYLWHEPAAAAIAARVPDARIVVSLRDPVERTRSSYWMWRRQGRETRSFEETVRAEVDAGPDDEGRPTRHVGRSFYAAGLRRYLERFEHVHVLFFDDLAAAPEQALRGLFAFLGVDEAVAGRIEPRVHNVDRLPRARALRPLLHTQTARVVGSKLPGSLTALAWKRPHRTPPDAATIALLEQLFRDDVREVETLIGRPVPWPRFAG
jgi:hypothetical protein